MIAREIAVLLAERAEALCRDLLPEGRREGAEWRCGSVQGEPGKSLGVHLTGAKAGVWSDFAPGQGGDALDLVKAARNLDTPSAIKWAKDWLGIQDDSHGKTVCQRTAPAPEPPPTKSSPDAERNATFARRIWSESQPAAETPVARYLASRGITIEPPPTLRYHPALKHGPTGLHLPAMIAGVAIWPAREVVAIHRTFLTATGDSKAPVSQNKMMLGPCAGGAVRLSPFGNDLVLAEGIETALSVLQASGKPVWACLSTSGLKSVLLPPEVATVTIAADGDEPGITAAEEAASRFYREGRDVKIAKPPPGMDFNDLLLLPENVVPLRRRQVRYG